MSSNPKDDDPKMMRVKAAIEKAMGHNPGSVTFTATWPPGHLVDLQYYPTTNPVRFTTVATFPSKEDHS